jgi:uncharacterized phage-associated protein
MAFHFNLEKALQAISAFLHFHGTKDMSYLRLLKLLYIADRESIKETGQPITGDHVVAMEHGPVLSGVYDPTKKGETTHWPIWSEFFRTVGYRLEMLKDPGNGKLSKYEIGKIRELAKRYEDHNEWDMVEITHTFEEWKQNNPGKSSKPIPLAHILAALGRSADEKAIVQEAHDQQSFDRLFAGACQ